MLKLSNYALTILFILVALFSACRAKENQTPASIESLAPPLLAKQAQQNEWERIERTAKQEGKLVILTDMGSALREKLTEVFATKYGIGLEFVVGRPAEFAVRLLAEFRAGIYTADLYVSGVTTAITMLKPAGVLEVLDPIIFLPEVTDAKAWWGGGIPWTDRDHTHIGFLAGVTHSVVINTDLVKPEEIRSYRDLLNPKWKGKIVLNDPTIGGSGVSHFTALAEYVMDLEFLRDLGKQEPEINRDNRLQVEWVARGKYPIGLFLKPEEVQTFIKVGAPIKYVILKEGGAFVGTSTGGISLIKNAPHPNAAKLFVNWILTKEGQTIFSQGHGRQSAREDVPFDHVSPEERRQPGIKYWSDSTEEAALKKDHYMIVAKDMYADLLK